LTPEAPWHRPLPGGGVSLRVHAQPGASRTGTAGLHGGALKLRVKAPALEDRANEALVEFLADWFAVPRRCVVLVSGARGRDKRIDVNAPVDPARVAALGR
jgi:uncharacterized protein (TIGR00251 family)